MTRCFAAASLLFLAATAGAQAPGRLDPGFAVDGLVFGASADSYSAAVVADADGTVTVAGTVDQPCGTGTAAFVARYRADGSRVAAFGQNGMVRFGACGSQTTAETLAALPDGSFLILTRRDGFSADYEARRILPSGQQTCQETVLFDAIPNGSAATPDGQVVVAVQSADGSNVRDVARIFVNYATGACGLDQSFGTGGFARIPAPPGRVDAYDVAVQPDGRVVVGGIFLPSPSPRSAVAARGAAERFAALRAGGTLDADPIVARLTASGAPDLTFGVGNVGYFVRRTPDDVDGLLAVATGPTGEIVGAGISYPAQSDSRDRVLVERHRFDGLLDPTFGTGGATTLGVPGEDAYASDVAVDSGGRVVAVGRSRGVVNADFRTRWLLARFNAADGLLDPAFGTAGVTLELPRGNQGQLVGVALAAGEDLYVAGEVYPSLSQTVYAVARYTSKSPVAGESGAPDGGAALTVAPNPTRGAATLALTRAEAGPVRVVLVDALGREVAVVFDGALAAGTTRLPVPTAGLPAGIYAVRMAGVAPVRLVVAR